MKAGEACQCEGQKAECTFHAQGSHRPNPFQRLIFRQIRSPTRFCAAWPWGDLSTNRSSTYRTAASLDRIEFTATVTRSAQDFKFGYYKRPTPTGLVKQTPRAAQTGVGQRFVSDHETPTRGSGFDRRMPGNLPTRLLPSPPRRKRGGAS